jgi:hypothetical protein
MAAALISVEGDLPIDDALRVLRMRKPTAEPLAHQRADLLAWRAARSVRSDP